MPKIIEIGLISRSYRKTRFKRTGHLKLENNKKTTTTKSQQANLTATLLEEINDALY